MNLQLFVRYHSAYPLLCRNLVFLQNRLGPYQVTDSASDFAFKKVHLLSHNRVLTKFLILIYTSEKWMSHLLLNFGVHIIVEKLNVLLGLINELTDLKVGS